MSGDHTRLLLEHGFRQFFASGPASAKYLRASALRGGDPRFHPAFRKPVIGWLVPNWSAHWTTDRSAPRSYALRSLHLCNGSRPPEGSYGGTCQGRAGLQSHLLSMTSIVTKFQSCIRGRLLNMRRNDLQSVHKPPSHIGRRANPSNSILGWLTGICTSFAQDRLRLSQSSPGWAEQR